MATTTTTSKSKRTEPTPETFIVRLRRAAPAGASREEAAAYASVVQARTIVGVGTYTTGKLHRVDAATADRLRREPRHEGRGHGYGEPHFAPCFDVWTLAEYEQLLSQERAALGREQRAAAERAAVDAVQSVVAAVAPSGDSLLAASFAPGGAS